MRGEILQLFPTPVADLEFRPLTDAERIALMKETETLLPNTGNKLTKNHYILDLHELRSFKEELTALINDYFQGVYCPASPVSLYITTSWVNIAVADNFHHPHNHFNSIISGSYYIETDEQDSITFYKDEQTISSLFISPHEEKLNIFNSKEYKLNVKKNNVVLFPANLIHGVTSVIRNPRISLSFNTFIKGEIGNERSLTQLTLR